MPMEMTPLVEKLALHEADIGGLTAHTGTLGTRPVVAIVTGMGTRLATEGTTRLLDAVSVGRVVVVGITGAVDDTTPIGTVVNPELVVDSATGDEFRPAPIGLGPPTGTMWTGDILLTDPDVIAGLRARGVVSLDMETAAIAAVCERRGVPWSVIRVISDRATDGSIDEELFGLSNQDGTPNMDAITRYMSEHPDRLAQMAQLAENAALATDTAAETAIRLCAAE